MLLDPTIQSPITMYESPIRKPYRGKIGTVLEVDVDGDDTRWGKFLRVRVEIDHEAEP